MSELSRWLSLVLRHDPASAGVTLDRRGFAPLAELARAATAHFGREIGAEAIAALAEPSPDPARKTRLEREGDLVRAGHGHSFAIEGYRPWNGEGVLFHATSADAAAAIEREGLLPMARHKVHLATEVGLTVEAARRKGGAVVVFRIDVAVARAHGAVLSESADPRVVLADRVPPEALARAG